MKKYISKSNSSCLVHSYHQYFNLLLRISQTSSSVFASLADLFPRDVYVVCVHTFNSEIIFYSFVFLHTPCKGWE